MTKAEQISDADTEAVTYLTLDERSEEYEELKEARRRLADLLKGTRNDLTDANTGERLAVDVNGIFIDKETGEYAVPITLKDSSGTVVRSEDLSIADAEKFVQYFLRRVRGAQGPQMSRVERGNGNVAERDGSDSEKAKTEGIEVSTERAIVDIAQEIGQLRQAITQTEGDLTEHEETIQRIMDKLDVAQSAFGNYADETDELAQQLTHLREKMERLQARAEGQRVASGRFAEGTPFEEAKALAQKADKEQFSIGENVYKRVGENYILSPNGSDEDRVAQENEEPGEAVVQGEESAPTQESERDALDRVRDAAIAQMLAAQSDHGAAMDAYRAARAAWVDAQEDSVQPGIRAQLLMQERKRFAQQLREATPDGDPLTSQQVRQMEKVSAGTKKERHEMEKLLSTTGFGVLVPEQFINADGTQMTPEEIREALNSELDAMQESLDAQLTQEQFSQTLAQRMGQKILVSLGLHRGLTMQVESSAAAQDEGGESADSVQKNTSEAQTAQKNAPEEEAQESNADVQKAKAVSAKVPQEESVSAESDGEGIPELTEKVDVEKEAVRNIAKTLQEAGVSSETFQRTIQKAPLEHFVASASGDSDALRFMLTYSGDVAEEFGDKFDHEGKAKKWTFGDYMLEVEKTRITKNAHSRTKRIE